MGDFDEATRALNVEIELEAAALVRAGVSPWQAMAKAVDVVLSRRRREARERRVADARTDRSA